MSVEMGAGSEQPNLHGVQPGLSADGRILEHSHFLPVRPGARFRVVFEPTANPRRQAVFLKATVPIQVAGQTIDGRPLVIWRHKAPEMMMLTFPQGGELMVRNSECDVPSMIVQEVPGGFRYCCTDPEGGADLAFRLENADSERA